MKSFRKALSLIVAFAMVLTLMVPVFAATPTDVVGTDYESAVGKLVTLGIIKGYEDGTFKPDQNITRAEFSKIACYLIGVQAAADLAKGSTKFKDVAASHWASGYINVAAEKGMLKGYPDKSFKPEANVTYAEAITILVRAIGMGDFVEKQGGTWPANYLEKASSAGITKDVAGFSGSTAALRGIIGQLAWNALEAEKWGAKEYTSTGITYGPIGKTLLEEQYKDFVYKTNDDKFAAKSFTDVKVVGTQVAGALAADEIKIQMNSALRDLFDITSSDDEDYSEKTVTVKADGIDLNSLFGKKVDLLFGKDNDVCNIRVASKDVVEGNVEKFNTTDSKVEMENGTKYSVRDDATIYVNTKSYSKTDFFGTVVPAISDSTAKVTLILKSGSIETMNVAVSDVITLAGLEMKQFVVKEVKNGDVKNVAASSSKQFDIDDIAADSDKCVIIKNGKTAAKDDIKAGDAVTYIKNTVSGLYYLLVTDNKVTGKAAKISNDTAAANAAIRKQITIDGKVYKMPYDGSAVMTKNNSTDDDDIKAIDSMGDFYNKDVTLTLNAAGEIMLVAGNITASSADMQVGVVSRDANASGDDYSVKILGQDGTVKSYTLKSGDVRVSDGSGDLEESANYTKEDLDSYFTNITAGTVVMFKVSADSKINAADFYVLAADANVNYGDLYVKDQAGSAMTITDETKKIKIGEDTFVAKSSTTYLNADTDNIENIKGWDSISSSDDEIISTSDPVFFVYDENEVLKSIIISTDSANYLASDAAYGIYLDNQIQSDDTLITLLNNGISKEYTVADDIYSGLEKGDLVTFSLNGDGEYSDDNQLLDISDVQDLIDDGDVAADVYKIDNWDSGDKVITFKEAAARASGETEKVVNLASDVVVYDCTGTTPKLGSVSDIGSGKYVYVDDYDEDTDSYGIVVIIE